MQSLYFLLMCCDDGDDDGDDDGVCGRNYDCYLDYVT